MTCMRFTNVCKSQHLQRGTTLLSDYSANCLAHLSSKMILAPTKSWNMD